MGQRCIEAEILAQAIDYFKLNKDYIEKLENELRSEECK